jgi:hypothetical protein
MLMKAKTGNMTNRRMMVVIAEIGGGAVVVAAFTLPISVLDG